MDLSELLRVIRTQWLIIGVATVIAAVAAFAFSIRAPHNYEADTQLYVSIGSEYSGQDAYQATLQSQQQVASYAILITGKESAARALKALGSNEDPTELMPRIKTSYIPETVILNVSVTDESPERAAALVNALATEFSKLASELDGPLNGERGPSRVTVVRAADVPTEALSRNILRNTAIAAVVGLLIGFAIASARSRFRDKSGADTAGADTANTDTASADTTGTSASDADTTVIDTDVAEHRHRAGKPGSEVDAS